MAVLLLGAGCGGAEPEPAFSSEDVVGSWLHSYEEDTADARVFRDSDHEFPPSRGREGFEIREDGEFVQLAIAPGDGLMRIEGRWHLTDRGEMVVEWTGDREPLTLQVAKVEAGKLTLSR